MALKIWLIRKIEAAELELFLKALLIMSKHVEKATDYPDDYSIRTDDVEN